MRFIIREKPVMDRILRTMIIRQTIFNFRFPRYKEKGSLRYKITQKQVRKIVKDV
jgi:hypothetical protein